MNAEAFRAELESLINRHSMEKGSNTPDFILAKYLAKCLTNFDETVLAREAWYGRQTGGQLCDPPQAADAPASVEMETVSVPLEPSAVMAEAARMENLFNNHPGSRQQAWTGLAIDRLEAVSRVGYVTAAGGMLRSVHGRPIDPKAVGTALAGLQRELRPILLASRFSGDADFLLWPLKDAATIVQAVVRAHENPETVSSTRTA